MTFKESKEIEVKIANDILNNMPFSNVYQLITAEAQARARRFVSEATEEQLLEVQKKMEEAEALAAKAAAEADAEAQTEKSDETN